MPYWRTIAPTVVKDLHRRPQIAQYISELLAMSVSEFLILTQVYTIPYLVLTKKGEILEEVAKACGRPIGALCMDRNNMAAILACILLQSSEDMESVVMKLLTAVSSEFGELDWANLVWAEAVLTASELLKVASEDKKFKRPKVNIFLTMII